MCSNFFFFNFWKISLLFPVTVAAYAYDSKDKQALLSDKTLCMNAVQGERGEFRHYDVHSLYGWSQTAPTLECVRGQSSHLATE